MIMHCVEATKEIGTKFNLTILTARQIIYALYDKTYMKLAPFESYHIDSR